MRHPAIFIIAAAVLAAFSCAKSAKEDYNDIEDHALDIWIKSNAPDAKPLDDSGIYYEVIESEPQTGKVDVRGKWIDVDYVMRDLGGDLVYTRNAETATLLGTYSAYTHYVPDRLYIASKQELSNLPIGLYRAVTAMPQGETWKVYVPSRFAFGSLGFSITNGYGGQKGLENDVPVIIDSLRIIDVIANPQTHGREAIERLATAPSPEGWGKMLNDTVRKGLYMEVYNRTEPSTDTIPLNQSADIYYKVRYLDGKLLYSNVDSVLYNNFGSVRSSDRTRYIRVTRMNTAPNNARQMPAKVFYAILPELCYGDIARIAVPAEYGYHDQYLPPTMDDTLWGTTTIFNPGDGDEYKNYTIEDTDSYFGLYTYYRPLNTSSTSDVTIGEVKPYTPLIYEFTVKRSQ